MREPPIITIVFVAGVGATLDSHVGPLSVALRQQGLETIGCCGGPFDRSAFSRTYALPPFRRARPGSVRRALRHLEFVIRKERPALLHLHSPPALVIGRVAGRNCDIPTLANVHGTFLEPLTWRSVAFAAVEGSLARLAAHTVVQNADDARFYARVVSPGKLTISPVGGIGVDVDRLEEARQTPVRVAEEPSLVVLGRLTAEKNLDLVVQAFRLLRDRISAATLTFVGSPAVGDRPWHVPDDVGIAHLPWADNPYAILAGADLLVSASRREGFGMNVVEALSLGVPVVAVSNRGAREIMRTGARGLTLVEADSEALASAMYRALKHHSHFNNDDLLSRWSRDNAVRFHARLIREVIADSRRRQVTTRQ